MCDILAQSVQAGKVDCGAETGSQSGGESTAPETAERVGLGGDLADGGEEGGVS